MAWLLVSAEIFAAEMKAGAQLTGADEFPAEVYTEFNSFNSWQQMLLAGATAFKPESAKRAEVLYFHPGTVADPQKGQKQGFKLEDGQFIVVSPSDAPPDLAVQRQQLQAKVGKQVVAVGTVTDTPSANLAKGVDKPEAIIKWAGKPGGKQ